MKFILTETFEASDKGTGQSIFKLKKGTGYDAINPDYIPSNSKILRLSGGDVIEKGEIEVKKYFFFYLFRTFFAVLKEHCYVPKTVDGKYNV